MFQNKNAAVIKANTFFDGVSKEVKLNVNSKDFIEKKEGEIIYQLGDPSDYVYLILEGEVKLKITGVFSSPVIVKNTKNEFFGEKELIENIKRTSSAVADTACLLYRINKQGLLSLVNQNKNIKRNLQKSLLMEEMDNSLATDEQKAFFFPKQTDTEKINPDKKPEEITEDVLDEPKVLLINDLEAEILMNEEIQSDNIEENLMDAAESPAETSSWIDAEPDKQEEDSAIQGNETEPATADTEINYYEETPENISELTEEQDGPFSWDMISLIPDEETPGENIEEEIQEEIIPDETIIEEAPSTQDESAEPERESSMEQDTTIFSTNTVPMEGQDILKDLLKSISADVQYPVQTIKFYAEQIKKKNTENQFKDVIDLLLEQVNSIADLLEVTTESLEEKDNLDKNLVSTGELLDDILGILADYTETRGSKLYKKYETTALINADRRKLYQAFFQVAKSLCESMPVSGKIFVSATDDYQHVKILFKNTGEEISPDVLGQMFEPFRDNISLLGLHTANSIIKNHGGSISAESAGGGTTFTILIPVAENVAG